MVHGTPNNGENKADFMNRCVSGGDSHDACELAWQQAHPPTLSLESLTGLFFDSAGFKATDVTTKFKKDMLHVGHYEHPSGKWELDVTPEILDDLVRKFNAMKSHGVPAQTK